MPKTYSVAEARAELPELLRSAEGGAAVTITRRGQSVAVILSVREYERLASSRPAFAQAYEAWSANVSLDETGVSPAHFRALRDKSPGRAVKL